MSRVIALKALYEAVPATVCPSGCGKCCGPVPVTPEEAAALGLPEGTTITPTDVNLSCSFLTPEGCSVYDRRPFMCRIFGASREPGLSCHIGCKPVKERMSAKDARRLVESYRKHMRALDFA